MTGQVDPGGLPSVPTDRDLLCWYQGGRKDAFAELYDRYARPLFFYLHSITEDAALAEDLLQDCFLRLVNQSPFRLHDSVRGLLFTIGRNLARDEARRASVRLKSHPTLEEARPEEGAGREEMERLSRALATLPPEQREVLVLKFHAELTFVQIGDVTGVPEPTVKSRYRYAIEKLGELLPQE